ncbi:HAD hydrolase-like protein [Cellulomonas alba]|uniref:HAD hydrolase-like protein n=1 Tax=Cellulomonas alba TaxID=3053467 RepID=A0ABT7SKI8_9CELL|nr:HAD hydrolase-like protein [Cellulomonas alba]MDM7856049.1 HAD hydrolase-like protein [Cellulomonas alba]
MTRPLVLLDLDGTLMDSIAGVVTAATAAYRATGLPLPTDAELRTFAGPPITDSFARHGVPADLMDAAVDAYRAALEAGALHDTRVFDGIPDALRALRAAGLQLLIATSKPAVWARPLCADFGLAELVDGVFGAPLDESTSNKAAVIGEALASLAEPPSAVVMVGDREHDVEGAQVHGVPTIGVTWGYALPGELDDAGAVALVDSPAELARAVLEQLRLAV